MNQHQHQHCHFSDSPQGPLNDNPYGKWMDGWMDRQMDFLDLCISPFSCGWSVSLPVSRSLCMCWTGSVQWVYQTLFKHSQCCLLLLKTGRPTKSGELESWVINQHDSVTIRNTQSFDLMLTGKYGLVHLEKYALQAFYAALVRKEPPIQRKRTVTG